MRVLNLSGKVDTSGYTRVYTVANFPDVVVLDDGLPQDSLREISESFPTVMLGSKAEAPPTVDYVFSSSEEVSRFLEEYARMTPRDRISHLYDRTFGLSYPDTVPYVSYYGYGRYLYNVLNTVLHSPLRPWVGIYGPNGTGKSKLVRTILGDRYRDAFHVAGESIGFKVGGEEEPKDVVVDVSSFRDDGELAALMGEIHRRRYQAIFIVEGTEVPDILSTVPFFYVPALSERPPKERLLLLEHILRRVERDGKCSRRVEMEEGFADVLYTYPWPNNLSELDNVLRFTLSVSDCVLKVSALPYHVKARLGKGDEPPAWDRYR